MHSSHFSKPLGGSASTCLANSPESCRLTSAIPSTQGIAVEGNHQAMWCVALLAATNRIRPDVHSHCACPGWYGSDPGRQSAHMFRHGSRSRFNALQLVYGKKWELVNASRCCNRYTKIAIATSVTNNPHGSLKFVELLPKQALRQTPELPIPFGSACFPQQIAKACHHAAVIYLSSGKGQLMAPLRRLQAPMGCRINRLEEISKWHK